MQLFYEIFPVFLFFIAFKFYDIYVATVVGIVVTAAQVIISRITMRKWDRKQLITLVVFLVFGGMTLYFHNPIFVKWKPTVVFWCFAVVLALSQFTQKPIMQRLMENVLEGKALVPRLVWIKINLFWIFFFMCLGLVNLYIAYTFSNDAWVNFKFYGITSALFVCSLLQAVYLMRFATDITKKNEEN